MAEKRLIDANGIVAVAEHAYDAWNLAMAAADGKREINLVYKRQELCKAVKAVAENCPTVDAVEVVRCKDCEYRVLDWQGKFYYCSHPNGLSGKMDGTRYCDCGERKDNA